MEGVQSTNNNNNSSCILLSRRAVISFLLQTSNRLPIAAPASSLPQVFRRGGHYSLSAAVSQSHRLLPTRVALSVNLARSSPHTPTPTSTLPQLPRQPHVLQLSVLSRQGSRSDVRSFRPKLISLRRPHHYWTLRLLVLIRSFHPAAPSTHQHHGQSQQHDRLRRPHDRPLSQQTARRVSQRPIASESGQPANEREVRSITTAHHHP